MEEYIPKYSKNAEMNKVVEGVNLIEQIKLHLQDILALRDKWKVLVKEDNTADEE